MTLEMLRKIFLLVKSNKHKGTRTKAQSANMETKSNLNPKNHQFINELTFNSEKNEELNSTNSILEKE
jgi:hypothetical protein